MGDFFDYLGDRGFYFKNVERNCVLLIQDENGNGVIDPADVQACHDHQRLPTHDKRVRDFLGKFAIPSHSLVGTPIKSLIDYLKTFEKFEEACVQRKKRECNEILSKKVEKSAEKNEILLDYQFLDSHFVESPEDLIDQAQTMLSPRLEKALDKILLALKEAPLKDREEIRYNGFQLILNHLIEKKLKQPNLLPKAFACLVELARGNRELSLYLNANAVSIGTLYNTTFSVPFPEEREFKEKKVPFYALGKNNADWRETMKILRKEGIEFPFGMEADYPSFVRGLKKFDIHFPKRFTSLRALHQILQNRLNPFDPGDPRPIALLIFPKTDWNLAFEQGRSEIEAFVHAGFHRVLYFEAGTEKEALSYLRWAEKEGRTIHTLVLAGHGTEQTLALGGKDLRILGSDQRNWLLESEELYFDSGDIATGQFNILQRVLDPHGHLLLFSCSGGKGGEAGHNLANDLHQLAPGVCIHSALLPTNIEELKIQKKGRLKVKFYSGDDYRLGCDF